MTATDFVMLGRLSPARARSGRARLQSLSACDGARHWRRRGAGADHGGEERREARAARRSGAPTHQSLLSAVALALGAWIYLWRTESILLAIGEPADLARDAGTYMRGYQWSLLPNLLFVTARCLFSALERPRPTLVAGLVAVAFNALANYALVFGELGMPRLGIVGSGLRPRCRRP